MKRIYTMAMLAGMGYTAMAQSAGNVIYNQPPNTYANNNYGGVQMVAYTPPPGVNLAMNNTHGREQYIKTDIMMNVKATSYTAIFSITQNGTGINQTDSLMNYRIAKMVSEISRHAQIKFEHHVDFITLVPRYKKVIEDKRFSKTVNEVPDGFEMKKNIHVLFYNHDHLAQITAAAGKAEIYELAKVEYNVKDMDAVYDQLRVKAKEILDVKYAKRTALGFKLEMTSMGEIQGAVYPIERYASYMAFKNGMPEYAVIESRKKGDKAQTVTSTSIEKTPVIYYERIPYNQFDAVINADAAEPCVQVYYSLQVNYRALNEEEELIKKEDRMLSVEMKKAEIKQKYNPNPAVKTR